jgi:GNAT superfamily N-acetyltransferase
LKVDIRSFSEKQIQAWELMRLYRNAGWWEERGKQDIDSMLTREISVGAWKGNLLIGFARAITDGKYRGYVEDVVIHRDYHKSGIGKKVVSKLLQELSHIDVISLFCDKDLIPFYEKNNFKHSKSQYVMHRK